MVSYWSFMTKEEFYFEYRRLHLKWPDKYMTDNPGKLRALFEMCQEFDVQFIRSFVDRALRANDAHLDLMKAIVGEKRARRELEKTKNILNQSDQITDGYLENILKTEQVDSLWEAILKSKGGA